MLVRGDASWGANYFTTLLGSISGQIALSTLKFAKEPWTSLSLTRRHANLQMIVIPTQLCKLTIT